MATSGDRYRRMIAQLIRNAEPRIKVKFLQLVSQIKSQLDLQRLASMLANGRIDDALRIVNDASEKFADGTIKFYAEAGATTATFLENALSINVSFNQTNFSAVSSMQANRLRLVREFTMEQTATTRAALLDGISRGINPIEQARAFRDSIGLTQRQYQAVANYSRLLEESSPASLREAMSRQLRDGRFDPTLVRTIEADGLLTSDQINRMIERYRERYIIYRSETIARTEALRSANEGSQIMFQQAVDSGKIAAEELVQEWITAHDDRTRDSHAEMNGQKRKFGEPFVTGNGYQIRYPGDPSAPASETINCRCTLTTRIKGL